MKALRVLLNVSGLAALLIMQVWVRPAAAEDRPLDFVRALQEHELSDIAVDYLKSLSQQSGGVPAEIQDVFDLEMSKSLRSAANQAFDARDAENLTAEAQKYLDKFLKEKPDHPEAVTASVSWASFAMEKALQQLRAAEGTTDKEQKAAQQAAARAMLEDTKSRFQQGMAKLAARLAKMPPAARGASKGDKKADKAQAARDAVETAWLNARFQVALCDYYSAQTYPKPEEPKDPKAARPQPSADDPRSVLLKSAAKGFDDIYQTNRVDAQNQINIVGLYAHMWHGKTMEEVGDLQTAIDIYEEVLANVPEPGQSGPTSTMDGLFAQVEHFRLLIIKRKQGQRSFLGEALQWLNQYRNSRQTEGYQALAFEVAKTQLALAKESASPDKEKLIAEAMNTLTAMSKVQSQFKQQAIILKRQYSKASTEVGQIGNFDEALAVGDEAAGSGQWANAVTAYTRGVELSTNVKDAKRIADLKKALGNARIMAAREQLAENKLAEAMATAQELWKDHPDEAVRRSAASLAVAVALSQYAAAPLPQRGAAMAKLEKLAKETIAAWPGKPEADDARIALGQANVVIGKVDEGIAAFQQVNPKSERYPVALFMAGRTHWMRYMMNRRSETAANKQQLAADRAAGLDLVQQGLVLHQKMAKKDEPPSRQHVEAQVLLAEMQLEGGEAAKAVALLQPLVEQVKAEKPESLDNTMLRIFVGAVKAYVALNNLDKAAEIGSVLVDTGADLLPVNLTLVDFARLLQAECQKAEAEVIKLESETAKADQAAKAKQKLSGLQEMLRRLIAKLATRKEYMIGGMVYIADTCAALGMKNEAMQQYDSILKRIETDPEFAKGAAKAETRVRAQKIALLRDAGKFDEAFKDVEILIKQNPRSLEPLMEKGRVLQGWSDKDPKRFDEAVAHWTRLRNLLQSMRKKPSEYYEVVYNAAYCLTKQAAKMGDPAAAGEKKKLAEQLLKSTLVLSPNLSGPDMVERYNKLIKEINPSAAPAEAPKTEAPKTEDAK